jgi:hypothetical protein
VAGFFLGDGAGVGKGRQLAGTILENWNCGRKKHIWLSVSADLKLDAERDLVGGTRVIVLLHTLTYALYLFCQADIGAGDIPTISLQKLTYDDISLKKGVLFVTYSSLVASRKGRAKKKQSMSRIEQIVKWCGGAKFDGCIMFDECHRAKNFVMTGKARSTRSGQAVFDLQEALPMARIVYCSATGATDPVNMGYMSRLGLWGAGTSFPQGFGEFLAAVGKGGIGRVLITTLHK